MRLSTTFVFLSLAAALLGGCGGSGDSTSTTTHGVDKMSKPPASATTEVRAEWVESPGCKHPQGASRWGCSVGSYRCQAVVTDRGWSVDCAKPGRSIAFTVKPQR
jgi:hypothetical protein